MGYPFLDARHVLLQGLKLGVEGRLGTLHQVDEDVVALAVGDNHADALVGHLAGNVAFRDHTPTAEAALASLDILAQVGAGLHLADDLRLGRGERTIVDAVDVAEDDEGVGVHHRGDETGELVVVGEHQFGDAHRVVLVDDGHHAILEHHRHAGTLVEVLAAGGETLFHREHLAYGDMVFAKEVVVEIDELGLTEGGEQLSLGHTVETARHLDLATPTGHGTTRDQNHLVVVLAQPGGLVDEGGDARDVELAVVTGQHVAANLHYDSFLAHSVISFGCRWRGSPPCESCR